MNVAGVCTTENDHREGELSDKIDDENVNSMLEETLCKSTWHSFHTDCQRKVPQQRL